MIAYTSGMVFLSNYDINHDSTKINQNQEIITSNYTWEMNGTVIADGYLSHYDPVICSIGNGSAIIAWEDWRNPATNSDIYAQRVNSTGHAQWTSNGIVVCNKTLGQEDPVICSDGNDGAFIGWSGDEGMWVQKINGNGEAQWGANGSQLHNVSGYRMQLCPDGLGGVIAVWDEGFLGDLILARRVHSNGTVLWGADPIIISNLTNCVYPKICNDSSGGVIITWQDYRTGTDNNIYAQKLFLNGTAQWGSNGTIICNQDNNQYAPDICTDNGDGAIITWTDNRSGSTDIYTQRILFNGTTMWTSNGTIICNSSGPQETPRIHEDGSGNAIIVWNDYRGANWDIYAQKIDGLGNHQWLANGTIICNATNTQDDYMISTDMSGRAFVTWEDSRTGGIDIFAQKIEPDGNVTWPQNGFLICNKFDLQADAQICSDELGGAIITWEVQKQSGPPRYDVYASRVIIPTSPTLESILPNPSNDGLILLNWSDNYDANKYYIYRNTSKINNINGLTPRAIVNATVYQDIVTANGLYHYVVVAENFWGNGSISNCQNVSVEFVPGPPILDPILPRIDNDGSIYLSWNDVIGATDYYIFRDNVTINSTLGLTPIDSVAQTFYPDSVPINGTFFYVIVAYNSTGSSPISNCENVTVDLTPPNGNGEPDEPPPDNTWIWISILIVGIAIAAVIIIRGIMVRSRSKKTPLKPPKSPPTPSKKPPISSE